MTITVKLLKIRKPVTTLTTKGLTEKMNVQNQMLLFTKVCFQEPFLKDQNYFEYITGD